MNAKFRRSCILGNLVYFSVRSIALQRLLKAQSTGAQSRNDADFRDGAQEIASLHPRE